MQSLPFDLNGGTTESPSAFSVPGLESLQGMLGTIMIGSAVLGGLLTILFIINLVQRVRADRAMIAMHKDIAAIREILEHQPVPATQVPTALSIAPTPPSALGE